MKERKTQKRHKNKEKVRMKGKKWISMNREKWEKCENAGFNEFCLRNKKSGWIFRLCMELSIFKLAIRLPAYPSLSGDYGRHSGRAFETRVNILSQGEAENKRESEREWEEQKILWLIDQTMKFQGNTAGIWYRSLLLTFLELRESLRKKRRKKNTRLRVGIKLEH